MNEAFIRIFGRWFGLTALLGVSVDFFFEKEQRYQWSQTTNSWVITGILLGGLLISLLFEINNIRKLTFKKIKGAIMGVDFFSCDYCGESICDCGDYVKCNDDCYRRWCDLKCAKADGYRSDNCEEEDTDECEYQGESCSYCRREEAEDSDLFNFLLKKYNLKREVVLKEYFEVSKNDEEGN